jgi:hypothetical protein
MASLKHAQKRRLIEQRSDPASLKLSADSGSSFSGFAFGGPPKREKSILMSGSRCATFCPLQRGHLKLDNANFNHSP